MGFSDNDVLQTKSANMVSSPSGISAHSEERSGELLAERGSGQPKYKQRRVLAVRHYPPGCGPGMHSTDLAGLENSRPSISSTVGQYPPRRKIVAVRDFPPNCGRNARPLSKEERKEDIETNAGDRPLSKEERKEHTETNAGDHKGKVGIDAVEWKKAQGDPRPRDSCRQKVAARKHILKLSIPKYDGVKVAAKMEAVPGFKSSNSYSLTKGSVSSGSKSLLIDGGERRNNQEVKWNRQGAVEDDEKYNGSRAIKRRTELILDATPSDPSCSRGIESDRKKVRDLLRAFHSTCRKLAREHIRRVDCKAADELKKKGLCLNQGESTIGAFPGVEVGDEFRYRMELNLLGLHRPTVAGIDTAKQDQILVAASVVASGGYNDNLDDSDVLDYTGEGGRPTKDKEAEDQKLEKGNLALMNSIKVKNHVRVIRGDVRTSDVADAMGRVYVYDGLYTVEECREELGPEGKKVFKFRMVRVPGQPELAWKQVSKAKKSKVREGLCITDISQGKESTAICAVNTIDHEKPPPFHYITKMRYPDNPTPGSGCGCRNGCSKLSLCACVEKNGGEIPYNHSGAIVEVKNLVFECGPFCKCPPSCYNRVSQKGIKLQLEIFKTGSRGWGVRSLNSIPSGTFICEYVGELIEDNEADRRNNDEYLFDIGGRRDKREGDNSDSSYHQALQDSKFTIDAAKVGNVGRFINHSCSPNLYAQDVLYDHGDTRIPHVMLFAVENIPPLRELTYDYNYQLDQVRDSDGNIMEKTCYCGSADCRGRMY